jgi:hypothetical protein
MNLSQCALKLQNYIFTQKPKSVSLSQLTQEAWTVDKKTCYQAFGSLSHIQTYVNKIQTDNHLDPILIDHHPQTTNQSSTSVSGSDHSQSSQKQKSLNTGSINTWNWFSQVGIDTSYYFGTVQETVAQTWWMVIGIVGIVILWYLSRYLIIFLYDVFNAHRIVYLKVMLPRGDTKSDREVQKELAKDMKEKIWRMNQVYRSIHSIWELGVSDQIMERCFHKAKFVLIMHYHDGVLNFIIWCYPEYRKIIEAQVSAQYSDVSIEITEKPHAYTKKYRDILPFEPKKDPIFPMRTFKLLEDDPMNNILDTMGKLSPEDTVTMQVIIKPTGERFNEKAKRRAEWLYRNDKRFVAPESIWWKLLLFPWRAFGFLFYGPEGKKNGIGNEPMEWGKDMVRMLKTQEESINSMGEEAASQPFKAWLLMISSSDVHGRAHENVKNMFSTFSVYRDEFNNEFNKNEFTADIMGFLFKKLWKLASLFYLPQFFFKYNVFSVNVLTSLFHLPDGLYNRATIIKWMDYKALSAPDNIPELQKANGKIWTGTIAEEYLWGKIPDILQDINDRYVGVRTDEKEKLTEIQAWDNPLPTADIVEKDGKKFIRTIETTQTKGFKLFNDWSLLGVNVYRNRFTPVYMTRKDRSRHHYIIGKSGGGKSVFIGTLARQDIWNGDGICVVDPHGDLVEDILQYVPKERAKDVIYFDAGNDERPMGLNLYEIWSYDEADRVVNDATEMFLKMFGPEIFGPRLQEYFKFGSLTLLEDMEDPPTLIDVPRVFTDETYRDYKVKKVTNPVVRNFWEKTFASIGDREKQEIIPYFTAKFVSFNTNHLIRNIIGQTRSAFRFRESMDSGKILLINLSKGRIWELNAQLLGMIIVAQIYNGAMARADTPEDQRRDFFLYVDEFQNFVTNTFADILSEARKYHLALIMAHQYIAQLDGGASNNIGESAGGKKSVKDAVFGNVGTMQSFKVGAPDAEFLEKEYAPVLSAQDIIGISNYKMYMKLNIKNSTSRVFSVNAIWTEDYKNPKVADVLKEYCGKKYGRKKEFVEAEIATRLWLSEHKEEEQTDADPAQTPSWAPTMDAWNTPSISQESPQTDVTPTALPDNTIQDQMPPQESWIPPPTNQTDQTSGSL